MRSGVRDPLRIPGPTCGQEIVFAKSRWRVRARRAPSLPFEMKKLSNSSIQWRSSLGRCSKLRRGGRRDCRSRRRRCDAPRQQRRDTGYERHAHNVPESPRNSVGRLSYLQFSNSVGLKNVIDRLPALYSFRPVSLTVPCLLSRLSRSAFEMFGAQWSATASAWRHLDRQIRAWVQPCPCSTSARHDRSARSCRLR